VLAAKAGDEPCASKKGVDHEDDMHRSAPLAVLTFLCVMSVAAPAWAQTIAVVRPAASDPLLTDAFSRLCGELHMYGLKVNVVQGEEDASRWSAQHAEAGSSPDIVGSVALLRTLGQASARIRIADAATGREGQRITVSIDDVDAPSLLAVRAVDLLRASLRDANLAERAQPETRPQPAVVHSKPNEASLGPPPEGFEPWAIRLGATTLWEAANLGMGMSVTAGIARRISPRVALEVTLMAPVVGQGYSVTGATARLRQELGIVAVAWRLVETRYLTLALSQGFGAAHLSVRGEAQSPWLPQSTSAWAAASSTGGCLGLRLSRHVGLDVALAAVFLLPRPVLEVADASYEVHQPLVLATGGIHYGF
jgi:hypothetical protein